MKKLEKLFPPGYPHITRDLVWMAVVEIAIILWALALYKYGGQINQIRMGVRDRMPSFSWCIHGIFEMYWVLLLACIIWALALRGYFTRRSHSDYTMRRLASGFEMTRRWLAAPLITAILGFVLCMVVLLVMRLHFVTATPAQNLPLDDSVNYFGAFVPTVIKGFARGLYIW